EQEALRPSLKVGRLCFINVPTHQPFQPGGFCSPGPAAVQLILIFSQKADEDWQVRIGNTV
ncbi:MAG: hypothetical protein OXE74_05805, partial [Cyanobacteria bacterium MAG CAR2_bin_4]|nr:hypothetical protein [Cyanobacteria bacterium MAG CAR2_bin_4]